MPGLPRPRLARLLRRRNGDDSRRASTVLIVGALLALGLAWDGSTRAALLVAIVCAALVAVPMRRVLRRNSVLTALEDGGVGGGGGEGGEHPSKVTESAGHGESAR